VYRNAIAEFKTFGACHGVELMFWTAGISSRPFRWWSRPFVSRYCRVLLCLLVN